MTLRRSLLPAIAIVLTAVSAAPAQFGPQGGDPPCFNEFMPLKQETEKRMAAAQAAGQRKVGPQEMCQLINRFSEAEAKMIKFVEENATWCGIPPQVAPQMKESQTKTNEVRKRVCAAAAAPARPAAPTLGDALGTSRVPDATKPKTGTGTFDTLTGSIPPAR
jgi:hypothetical protein